MIIPSILQPFRTHYIHYTSNMAPKYGLKTETNHSTDFQNSRKRFRISACDSRLNRTRNLNLRGSRRCHVSHRFSKYLFPRSSIITGRFMAISECGLLFIWICHRWCYQCMTHDLHKHPQLYTCMMLFVWHQSFSVKSSSHTSWQISTQTNTLIQTNIGGEDITWLSRRW